MSDPTQDSEYKIWKWEQDRAIAERAHDAEREFMHKNNDAAITSGNFALRSLILINGGAAIAMLAFLGQLVSNNAKLSGKLSELNAPLAWFAWGVALATLAVACAYFTNYSIASASGKRERTYTHPFINETSASRGWLRVGLVFQISAIIAGLLSLLFFILGMVEIRDAVTLLNLNPSPSQGS